MSVLGDSMQKSKNVRRGEGHGGCWEECKRKQEYWDSV